MGVIQTLRLNQLMKCLLASYANDYDAGHWNVAHGRKGEHE